MSGTKSGGKAAAATNKRKYGQDFYKRIAAIGGKKSNTGGFYWMSQNDPERLREIGKKGGRLGRRGKSNA